MIFPVHKDFQIDLLTQTRASSTVPPNGLWKIIFPSLCTQNNHNNQHSSFPVRSQSAFICCLSITILFLICRNQSLWLGSDLHVLTTCPRVIHTEWSHRLATLSDGSWFASVWLRCPIGKPWCHISSQVKCVTLSESIFVVELSALTSVDMCTRCTWTH